MPRQSARIAANLYRNLHRDAVALVQRCSMTSADAMDLAHEMMRDGTLLQ